MWSVWSERVDVYLGAGLVLVQRSGQPLWTFEPPGTLPLADVLKQVDQALNRKNGKPWRLRIHLSATHCAPVAFVVPASVRCHQEVLAISRAHGAQIWAMPGEPAPEIVCSLDARHVGLAACMLAGTNQVITRWAQEHQGRLVSQQPLWATATRARACRARQAHSVAVLEPDALTVLELKPQSAARATSWMGRFNAAEALARLADLRVPEIEPDRWSGVAMAFSRDPAKVFMSEAPTTWACHWSVLS